MSYKPINYVAIISKDYLFDSHHFLRPVFWFQQVH